MSRSESRANPTAPATRRDDATADIHHGTRVPDPYRWLENVASDEVQEWMVAQDRHARERLAALPHREALRERLRELFYADAVSPPVVRGGRMFFSRRHKDREKALVYWRPSDGDDDDRVLFDPNTWSEDGSVSLGVWVPSPDGRRVAYAVKENAADEATVRVRDVDRGEDLPADVIHGAKYASPSWTPDGASFYYTRLPTDEAIPVADRPGHAEVRRHVVGTTPEADELIHPATGSAKTFIDGRISRDGQFLFVTIAHGWNSTDVYVRHLQRGGELQPLVVGQDAIYDVRGWDGRLYVLTNEGAPRYRVFEVDPARLGREHWRELIAESDATIESLQIAGGRLVLGYLRNAASVLEIRDLEGALVGPVPLPGIGTVDGVIGTETQDTAYFSYSSFVEPPQVFEISISTGETRLWAEVELPIDTSAFAVDQTWYHSKDGTRVSMFVIRPADLARTGDAPTVLYGYGGFSVSLTPSFSSGIAAWLERGGVYAIPNLRGGGEYGEAWHRAGMLLNKQNVFDDFIAAAEHLIAEGYTRPERLAIRGGSNGGLLVGAAMTQRPDLFAAVICAVPLLDMIRMPQFGSGTTWVPEYGSPEDPEQFRALWAYSPYHRVAAGTRYPPLLMLSADSDDRVDPMHARKFVAAVQAASPGAPSLLRIEHQAGHGGADKVAEAVEQGVDSYAFLLDALGVSAPR